MCGARARNGVGVRHAHVPARQQRDTADLLDQALTDPIQSVTQSVTDAEIRVVWGGTESPKEGHPTRGKWLRR